MGNKVIQGIGFCFFLLALFLVHKEITRVGGEHMIHLLQTLPLERVGIALGLTALDFCFLAGYDILGLRYLHKHVPLFKVCVVSCLGFAVSNTTGHAYLAGGSLRYTFYKNLLSRLDILKLITLDSLTFLLGMSVAFIAAVCLLPLEGGALPAFYMPVLIGISGVLLLLLGGYFFAIVRPKRMFHLGSVFIKAPSWRLTLWQLGVGLGDVLSTFLVFYVILSGVLSVPFWPVMGMFILAWVLGLCSQIPGGLGVFEGTFLYLFSWVSPNQGEVLTALLVFRVLYYFVPFLVATLAVVGGWGIKKLWGKLMA